MNSRDGLGRRSEAPACALEHQLAVDLHRSGRSVEKPQCPSRFVQGADDGRDDLLLHVLQILKVRRAERPERRGGVPDCVRRTRTTNSNTYAFFFCGIMLLDPA
jgi:hypothetical protein